MKGICKREEAHTKPVISGKYFRFTPALQESMAASLRWVSLQHYELQAFEAEGHSLRGLRTPTAKPALLSTATLSDTKQQGLVSGMFGSDKLGNYLIFQANIWPCHDYEPNSRDSSVGVLVLQSWGVFPPISTGGHGMP